jgi:hypothetical protein
MDVSQVISLKDKRVPNKVRKEREGKVREPTLSSSLLVPRRGEDLRC